MIKNNAMNFLKTILILFIISLTTSVNAQRVSDIGMIYGSSELYRLNIEYRKPIKEKTKLKFGISMGAATSPSLNYGAQITLVTDSLIVTRNYSQYNFQMTLKTGFEHQLKESMFSFGADLLLGYKQLEEGYYDTRDILTNGGWTNEELVLFSNFDESSNRSYRRTNYLTPGVQFNFSMDIPIKESFFLHLFVSQILTTPVYLGQNIINNPNNEFQTPNNAFTFNSQNQAGIGLRYRFKK